MRYLSSAEVPKPFTHPYPPEGRPKKPYMAPEIVASGKTEGFFILPQQDILTGAPAEVIARAPGLFDQSFAQTIDSTKAQMQASALTSSDLNGYQGGDPVTTQLRDDFTQFYIDMRGYTPDGRAEYQSLVDFRDVHLLPLAQAAVDEGVAIGHGVLTKTVGDLQGEQKARAALEFGAYDRVVVDQHPLNTIQQIDTTFRTAVDQREPFKTPDGANEGGTGKTLAQLRRLQLLGQDAGIQGIVGIKREGRGTPTFLQQIDTIYRDPTNGGEFPDLTADQCLQAIQHGVSRSVAKDVMRQTSNRMYESDPDYAKHMTKVVRGRRIDSEFDRRLELQRYSPGSASQELRNIVADIKTIAERETI